MFSNLSSPIRSQPFPSLLTPIHNQSQSHSLAQSKAQPPARHSSQSSGALSEAAQILCLGAALQQSNRNLSICHQVIAKLKRASGGASRPFMCAALVEHKHAIEQLKHEQQHTKQQITQQLDDFLSSFSSACSSLVAGVSSFSSHRQSLSQALEARTRTLQRRIMENSKNIRVLARVKPINKEEDSCLMVDSLSSSIVINKRVFEFDFVWPSAASQQDVFEQVEPLIHATMQGFNAAIFAYGQSGAGKSHTMFGFDGLAPACSNARLPQSAGLTARSLRMLFDELASPAIASDYSSHCSLACFEVWNDHVFDLLAPVADVHAQRCDIGLKQNGLPFIKGLTQVAVQQFEDALPHFHRIFDLRSCASTDLNSSSSRSHCVSQLTVAINNRHTGAEMTATLSLVDLAGSENCKKSGATGQTLEETKHINKSLAALTDVFAALARKDKQTHIPFRNSKLSWLLSDSLGGNSKTAVIICVPQEAAHRSETASTLNFGALVGGVQTQQSRNIHKKATQ